MHRELMALFISRLVALDTLHILFSRCSLASLCPCLQLSLRDTQHSRSVLSLAWPLSHRRTQDHSLSLLVLMQSPRERQVEGGEGPRPTDRAETSCRYVVPNDV